jgi:hypothetical protein
MDISNAVGYEAGFSDTYSSPANDFQHVAPGAYIGTTHYSWTSVCIAAGIAVVVVGSVTYFGKKAFFPSTLHKIKKVHADKLVEDLKKLYDLVEAGKKDTEITAPAAGIAMYLTKEVVNGKGIEHISPVYQITADLMSLLSVANFKAKSGTDYSLKEKEHFKNQCNSWLAAIESHVGVKPKS